MNTKMTITEKILAVHAGVDAVSPGDLITVTPDIVLANDVTFPMALKVFKALGAKHVFDRNKIVLVADHYLPNNSVSAAENTKLMRDFASDQEIEHFFAVGELGEPGIEHVILPEKGLVLPGQLIVGGDSHTCTYGALGAFSAGIGSTDLGAVMATGKIWLRVPPTIKLEYEGTLREDVRGKDIILYTIGKLGVEGALYSTLEFSGEVITRLPMSQRFTITNMAVEAGAKNGIIEPDEISEKYVKERFLQPYVAVKGNPAASYVRKLKFNVEDIEPQVALPYSPANVCPISNVGNIKVDQVFIGSCTNGWIEDLRDAASVLKDRKIAKGLRLIIIPGSQQILQGALREGLIDIFVDSGAVIGPPACGPCFGGQFGVLAAGERAVSTTNRNFIGRMGHPSSEVYLANPLVAASSAILGKIGGIEQL